MTQRLIAQKNIFLYPLQGADIKRRKPERMLRVRRIQCSCFLWVGEDHCQPQETVKRPLFLEAVKVNNSMWPVYWAHETLLLPESLPWLGSNLKKLNSEAGLQCDPFFILSVLSQSGVIRCLSLSMESHITLLTHTHKIQLMQSISDANMNSYIVSVIPKVGSCCTHKMQHSKTLCTEPSVTF